MQTRSPAYFGGRTFDFRRLAKMVERLLVMPEALELIADLSVDLRGLGR